MGSTIECGGDLVGVTRRCSGCGARVAAGTLGAETDCCATGRVMAWRVQRQQQSPLSDGSTTARLLSINGLQC